MATRKSKSPKALESQSQVKALTPRDIDVKYMGDEPLFVIQPDESERLSALARAFAWYHRFYGKKDAKELMAQYLELAERTADSKAIRKVADSELLTTFCWLARMKVRGLVLAKTEETTLEAEVQRLLQSVYKPEVKTSQTTLIETKVEVVPRQSIQEIMREKASEAAGELEGMFDDFMRDGAKINAKFKPIDIVAKKNIAPQHISLLIEIWKRKQDEFAEVTKGKDAQLVQAYAHLSKMQLKSVIKFIDGVMTDLNSYISVKKAARAPKARKAVPIEKQVSKLKFLKVFKDAATKLDLVSISPTKLHGASEAWVYDTAKRKLHHYLADEYSKTFTVKGNVLLGIDSNTSEVKTLRKPAEQIKEIMGSKPSARKYFKDIKAVSVTPNGRFNESMVILKAF